MERLLTFDSITSPKPFKTTNYSVKQFIINYIKQTYFFTSGILSAQPAAKSGNLKTVGFSAKA